MRHALVVLCLVAASAGAQQPAQTVSGVVFDSMASAPLGGAIVQAVRLDSAARPTADVYWGVADRRGVFAITNLPRGRFAFGFQHEALRALGLESPIRVIDSDGAGAVTVNLAIPPASVVRKQSCAADGSNATDGMLAGYVLDAASGTRIPDAVVELRWVGIAQTEGGLRTSPHRVTATVSEDGAFVACGLPGNAPIEIVATRDGYRELRGEVVIPSAGVLRRELRLASSASQRGTAALTGRLLHRDSTPVSSGSVRIAALKMDAVVTNGVFTLSALPAGTWSVEARAIGYEPQSSLVDVLPQTTSSVTMVLDEKVQHLEAMRVVGRPSRDYKQLEEVLERKQLGFGTFFMPGNEHLVHATQLSDVVQWAKGFALNRDGFPVSLRNRGCLPTIYVDGMKNGNIPPMDEVLAIAAYPTVTGTPVQWRDNRMCSAIVIWTKQ